MNHWKPDANEIEKIQQLVKIGLPKLRPTIVGLNCDATLLEAVANATTKNLLLADGLPDSPEIPSNKSINRINGELEKIFSMLTKLEFNADLFVLGSFSDLPIALSMCDTHGEGILLTDAKSLENFVLTSGASYADTAKHLWGQVNLDSFVCPSITAVFFARDHTNGISRNTKSIDRAFRMGSELRVEQRANTKTIEIWNEAKRRIHRKAIFEIQETEGAYSITLGPGIVKYFDLGNFLESSADEVISLLKSTAKNFTLKIPDHSFSLASLPYRGSFIGNFSDCNVNISDIDGFLATEDWERRLRIHHAFCHFCFSNAMSSHVYACFHEWLDLKEFAFDECLRAWVKNGDQSATILDSYRNSTEHAVVSHENRYWLVFAKTPFLKGKLEAKEAEAANQISASEIDRLRKSKFDCYVYLMEDLRNKSFKIGKSKSPGKRERTLQSEVPQIVMRFSIPVDEAHEKQLHENFDDKRIRGEWFALKNEDLVWLVAYLKKHGDVSRASVDFDWLGSIHFSASTTTTSK